jgi:hypothetical protein
MLEPHLVRDGLAMYRVGAGEPVLFMAYPHATALFADLVRCNSCGNSSHWDAR